MTTPNDLQSKLDAITHAAVGALGFLPVNVPGARMAKERIEAALAGLDIPDQLGRFCGKCGAEQEVHVKVGPGRYRAIGMTAEADTYVAANPETGERARLVATIAREPASDTATSGGGEAT